MSALVMKDNKTWLNGKEHRIIAGAMHYFRVMPEQWRQRLMRLKELGINTIETYCAWNLHEPYEGKFDFSGRLNFAAYLDLCAELDFDIIVRPGPYICTECDAGGLPWWLLEKDCAVRTNDTTYLLYAMRYLKKIADIVKPRQMENGGRVIAMQVENEYGSYTLNHGHIEKLASFYRNNGIEVLLFTSDAAIEGQPIFQISGGADSVYRTANFRGPEAKESIALMREIQPNAPVTVTEFWNGRSIKYGMDFTHREAKEVASHLDTILSEGANVTIYMAHGGSNFGYFNGALYDWVDNKTMFVVQSSSYDVDAPLNEYGETTDKFLAEREVIFKHLGKTPPALAPSTVKLKNYGEVKFTSCAPVLSNLDLLAERKNHVYRPVNMEKLGQGHGTIVYSTTIDYDLNEPLKIKFDRVADVAAVYENGVYKGEVWRDHERETSIEIEARTAPTRIDIVVENLGRCCFGRTLNDKKGLLGDVSISFHRALYGFDTYSLPFRKIPHAAFIPELSVDAPALYRGEFEVDEIADTFVKLTGFTRGSVFVNGFNLGRHFAIGPHKTLYLPAPLLKKGVNELIVFDARGAKNPQAFLTDKQELVGKSVLRSPFGDDNLSDNTVVIK